jgi:hypothetical protein
VTKKTNADYQREWRKRNSERSKFFRERWNKANPESRRLSTLKARIKRQYGITLEEYEQRFEDMGGKCGICEEVLERGKGKHALDHCHNTGQLRGFLCGKCNRGLGYFQDNPELLTSAVRYLQLYAESQQTADNGRENTRS